VEQIELLAAMMGAVRPDEVASSVQRVLENMVGGQSQILVIDYAQTCLVQLVGAPTAHRDSFAVDATVAGRAYTTSQAQEVADEAGYRIWLPLLQGAHRIGVLEVRTPSEITPAQRGGGGRPRWCVARSELGERRRVRYPPAFADAAGRRNRVGAPAAVDVCQPRCVRGWHSRAVLRRGRRRLRLRRGRPICSRRALRRVGHGLTASRLSSLTVAAYRNARRSGLDLVATAVSIDEVLQTQAPPNHFVTALLAELDLDSGRYRRISAGHPGELLARGGKVIRQLAAPSWTPLGLGYLELGDPEVFVEQLEPGDHLLLYSDGATEARSATGELFGEDRLGDYLVKALADGLPAAETMRRLVSALLQYQKDQLQDDATAVLVGWRTDATPP
jgi:Stage II sporulation protein E (SpoIIE)